VNLLRGATQRWPFCLVRPTAEPAGLLLDSTHSGRDRVDELITCLGQESLLGLEASGHFFGSLAAVSTRPPSPPKLAALRGCRFPAVAPFFCEPPTDTSLDVRDPKTATLLAPPFFPASLRYSMIWMTVRFDGSTRYTRSSE
jgi:hypothetical protein